MSSGTLSPALVKVSPETEEMFDLVDQDVRGLWFDLVVYEGLFTEAGVAILNRRTGAVFRVLQNRLYDGHHMRIGRLLDPSSGRRGARRNVSLVALLERVKADGAIDLASDMEKHLVALRQDEDGIRWQRNKLIGHKDLDAAMRRVQPPDVPTLQTVRRIAEAADAFMNCYAGAVRDTQIMYSMGVIGLGGPEGLLEELELAERYRQAHPDYWMSEATRAAVVRLGLDPAEMARRSRGESMEESE